MFTKVSVVAFFAGLAAAYHKPVGDQPSGNSIHRPLNEVVPACKPFEIKWTPTTPNTVSLILLRGPASNLVYLDTIVEGIANSGSFSWTPKSSLEADTTHYGIQLIDDVTGQYQYTTQFGISKDSCSKESSYPTASGSGTPSGYPSSTSSPCPSSTPVKSASSAYYPTTTKVVVASTGYPVGNSSVITGTKPLTVPSSLKTSATATGAATGGQASSTPSTTPPASPGAASGLSAGMGLAGLMAVAVLML